MKPFLLMELFSHQFFMREALKEAEAAYAFGEVPVGAIVTCNNRIIARAHNRTEQLIDVTAHAEILAITAASNALGSKYLHECTMYVTLEPCAMCAGALHWAQLGSLVVGAVDEKRGAISLKKQLLHPSTTVLMGVNQEPCALLLKRFFKEKRGL